MNTPSHYVLNLALLGKIVKPKEKTKAKIAITIGSLFPDVSLFIFYFITKFIQKLPESQIWDRTYYEPAWQNFIAWFNSIPLTAIALLICLYFRSRIGAFFFGSMLLHLFFDLPFHNHDAYRHFFPFSDYRFFSPISYWDPQHHATFVALGELLLVLAATPFVFKMLDTRISKIILIGINVVYIVGYAVFYGGLYRFFN